MKRILSTSVLLIFVCGVHAAGAELPVALTVKEHGKVARPSWPVTSGVPLPRGAVKESSELSLSSGGKAVPCQFNTVTRWPDGSVKWTELNFQADLPAGGECKYRLAKGASKAAAIAVTVTEAADAFKIDTGTIAFTVPKQKGNIIGEIRSGGKLLATGQGVRILGARDAQKGLVFSTLNGKVEKAEVERSGPVMVRLHLLLTCSTKDGKAFVPVTASKKKYGEPSGDFFKVRVRMWAYAGKPYVYMTLSLLHRGPMDDSADAFFKSAALELKPATALTEASSDGVSGSLGGKGFRLFQYLGAGRADYAMKSARKSPKPHFKVLVDGAEKKAGQRASGNVVTETMGFGVRRFYEYAPTAITVKPEKVAVEMLPDDPEQEMHVLDQGRQRSHEILLDFSTKAADALAAFQAPRLLALASPSWYADLEVFGMIAEEAGGDIGKYPAAVHKPMQRFEQLQRAMVDEKSIDRKNSRTIFAYMHPGWLDYGDLSWAPGWSNGHYDWSLSMILHFLRTGRREFFEAADAMAWHRMDIAQNHSLECGKVRPQRAWCRGLTFYEKDNHRSAGAGPKPTHSWNRGLGYYALLTGNETARQTALLSGKGLKQYYDRYGKSTLAEGKWAGNWKGKGPVYATGKQEQRTEGWSIENFLGCYEITGEQQWLHCAANLFKATLLDYKRQKTFTGKGIKGNASLMFAYCLSPACRTHHYSRDPEVLAGIRYMIDEGVVAEYGNLRGGKKLPDGKEQMTAFSIKAGKIVPVFNVFYANPIAYTYMQTGDKKYLNIARKVFRNGVYYYTRGRAGPVDPQEPRKLSPAAYKDGMYAGSHTKAHGWLGRYGQIYLYMEKQLANGKKFPRK